MPKTENYLHAKPIFHSTFNGSHKFTATQFCYISTPIRGGDEAVGSGAYECAINQGKY